MREPHPRIVLGLHRSRYQRRTLAAALDLGVRAIDTAFNYHGFSAHQALAEFRDLLPQFRVSTRVGYFPGPSSVGHSLDPSRLRYALEQTNRDLRQTPDLVFIHNPERTLSQLTHDQARDCLTLACTVLVNAVKEGLCTSWGIASWRPEPLLSLIDGATPRPEMLMVRSGLLVGTETLDAAECLAGQWNLPSSAVRGMSPFGGSPTDPVWDRFNTRVFLRPDTAIEWSPIQAAFRAAYYLPRVSAVAVGSDDPAHLRELVDALRSQVDEGAIVRYRSLLRGQRGGANSSSNRRASA